MKTFDNYETDGELSGWIILGRVMDALLVDSACQYSFRSQATKDQLANWDARNTIAELRFSFVPALNFEQIHDETIIPLDIEQVLL